MLVLNHKTPSPQLLQWAKEEEVPVIAGPLGKQPLETQVDVALRQRSKFLSDQQPRANARTPQTTKIFNPWIPLASYNTIQYKKISKDSHDSTPSK